MARRRAQRFQPDAVRIRDFSDRELLAIIGDLTQGANGAGYVTTADVAERCFGAMPDAETANYYARCVGSRFAWMRRFGLLDKGEESGVWHLSKAGNALRRGRISAGLDRSVLNLAEDSTLVFAASVGERLLMAGDVQGKAMERELRWSIERRKRERA